MIAKNFFKTTTNYQRVFLTGFLEEENSPLTIKKYPIL